jgi:hypothetical protein
MKRVAFVPMLVVSVALLLSSISAFAQTTPDPLVGTWNIRGAANSFIAVMTFNAGGTTVEYDTAGTNSSASPGETISLGKWSNAGGPNYSFKEENYIYDGTGALAFIAVANCSLTLSSTKNSFTDKCTVNIHTCTVKSCPGAVVQSSVGPAQGTRF